MITALLARRALVSIRERLGSRARLKSVVANTGWLVADKVVQIVVNLFVGVWLARYLGPEQRGILTYATSFVSILIPVSALGLGGILVRDLVREPDAKGELMGTVFAGQLVGYILLLPVIFGAILVLRRDQPTVQLAVMIVALGSVFCTSRVFGFWFQSQLQSKYQVIATRIVALIVAGVKIWLIVIRAPLIAFVVLVPLNLLLVFIASLAFYAARGEHIRSWRFNPKRAISMLKVSWPLIFSVLAATIHSEIDTVMLGHLMGDRAVGIYGEAVRFSRMWYLIPTAIASSAYPELVYARQSLTPTGYRRRTQLFFDVLSGVGYLSAIPMALAAPVIIRQLYGTEYLRSGYVMSIHVWTFIFVALRQGLDRWLMVESKTQYAMWLSLIGGLLNIVLNLWMVPAWGIIGAAWATVISTALSIGLVGLLSPKLRPLAWQLVLALSIPFRLPWLFLQSFLHTP